ncbi:hypothetical protein [Xanthobacter oligotrophicus]|uniref:hypothetical protein n=1 Tax=Xanthobacter oligotrophicus TaxID=2607286 RepID=UPI0011F13C2F|nr:hypothetical protein [Xanthobacter oligotrophicus]MCG5237116.1 hypothetical protein [Xanthobacter oligotrophicus]
MPFDETTPVPELPTPRVSDQVAISPTLMQTAGAAFRQDNLIGSVLSSEQLRAQMDGGFHDVDRNYNVFDDIAGYENHADRFVNVFNAKAAKALKADIDRETQDRRILAASGWTGFAMTAGASVLDPTFLLPGGAIAKTGHIGTTMGRAALSLGGAAAGAAAVQEAGLQASQELRTGTETALAIGGSALLGGFLGAGIGGVMTAVEARRAATALAEAQRPYFDAATDALHRELVGMAGPQGAGADATRLDTLDDLTVAGSAAGAVAKATAQLNPVLRTLHSPSAAVRSVASQIMEIPVYLRKNLEGAGDSAAETNMHQWTRGAVASAMEAQETAYVAARKAGGTLTRKEFREEVGRAMRRGDQSDILGVADAARAWRSSVIDPLKRRAIEAGLLPEDVSVSTADSYFSRLWNRPVMEANEAEFREIASGWLSTKLDEAMAAEAQRMDRRTRGLLREKGDLEATILRREENARRRMQEGGEASLDGISESDVLEVLRRVNAGERPRAPESLSQWLRGLGREGIFDAAGELTAVFPEARKIPGLLRKSRRARSNPSGGISLDELAALASREGFLDDFARAADDTAVPAGQPSARDLIEALFTDTRGRRVVRAGDREAARGADAFDSMMQALDRAGVDLARPMFGTSDALKGIAGTINRVLSDMDRARIAQLDAALAESRASRFDFLDDADRADYISGIVDDIYAKLTGRGTDGNIPKDLVVTKRGPLKERTFNIPDELVEKFLDSDAEFVGRRYARIMSADIELAERFGSADLTGPLETIRHDYAELRRTLEGTEGLSAEARAQRLKALNDRERADIRDLEAVRDMLRGNYRPEIQHTGWARALNAAGTFNYMVALGGVTIASLTDAVRPAMVHGLASYIRDGLRPLISASKGAKLSRQEAKLAGAISDRVLASRLATLAELTDPYAQTSVFERFLTNAASGFSRLTGLLHWNDFQRGIAATMIQNRILQNAEVAALRGFDALPPKEKAYMGFLGIGQERAESLGHLFQQHGETLDGVRVANTERWGDDEVSDRLRRAYRAAVNKDADSVIVAKGVGDVPLFMSTPIGRSILQFRSFAIAANQRVLLRGLQEDTTRFLGGVVGMTTVGAFIYMLKQIETQREISDNPGTWIAEGLDRSGIFSIAFEVNNALEKIGAPGFYTGAAAMFPNASQRPPASRFAARSRVGSFLGPSFGTATDVVGLLGLGFENMRHAAAGEDLTIGESDVGAARRLVPYASLPYWRWLVDGMIVPEIKQGVAK